MKRATINRIYVPKFNGNLDLDTDEQVTVEMDLATLKERDKYSIMKYGKGGSVELVKKEYTALRDKVKVINNYFDDQGNPIDTAKKLIEDMTVGSEESTELCIELFNKIMGYTSKEDSEEKEETEDFISDSGEELTEGES